MADSEWESHPLGGASVFPVTGFRMTTAMNKKAGVIRIEYGTEPTLKARKAQQFLLSGRPGSDNEPASRGARRQDGRRGRDGQTRHLSAAAPGQGDRRRASRLARDLGHEAFADHDRVHGDHRAFAVAAVAFGDDHGHLVARQRRLDRRRRVRGRAFHDLVAAAGLRDLGQRGAPAGIGRLVAGGAIRAIVDDQQDEVAAGGCSRSWPACPYWSAPSRRHRWRRPSCPSPWREAEPDRGGQPHRAEHVEIATAGRRWRAAPGWASRYCRPQAASVMIGFSSSSSS